MQATDTAAEAPPADDHPSSGARPTPTARPGATALALGALGVVFGDIGTSPLYAMHTVFSEHGGRIGVTPGNVHGVISMVFWSITIVVSIKYVAFVMRADNDGEGGIMALIALVRRIGRDRGLAAAALLVGLGVFGASLFFGDAMITPAISVLSAVEGLKVVSPSLGHLVVPIALTILVALFAGQRFGTGAVGRLFGPVCALWFGVLAVGGLAKVIQHPSVATSLSPTYAIAFAGSHPALFFIALAGVVLTITGVEALYTDMGHFGRPAITRAWFLVVFPALTLNYLGQGALILHAPRAVGNPFFELFPHWAQIPVVLLATAATVIASQAVISGAFSVSRQAMQQGFLPRLTVRHTSSAEIGQVYVPAVNWGVLLAVAALVLGFGTSAKLAGAYGIAVTGTLAIDTLLFCTVARFRFGRPLWLVLLGGALFLTVDLMFFSANVPKVVAGGWFPILIALGAFAVFTTWDRGRRLVTAAREREEGPLRAWVEEIHALDPPVYRSAGTGVFLNANRETTPLALRANVEHNHALHQTVVIVSVETLGVPSVPESERVSVDDLGYADDGIFHVTVRVGFRDSIDVPAAIALAAQTGLEAPADLDGASYFVSRVTLRRGTGRRLSRWRKVLFLTMARHTANPVEYFNLPIDRTIVMGGHITV